MHNDILDIAKAIQLSLAPAFLLTGMGALLNVITGRLARIMDRGRALAEDRSSGSPAQAAAVALERRGLEPRRHFASVAVTAVTIAALLVCVVIAGLFLEVMLGTSLKWLTGSLFASGMLALVIGLTYFLREVHLATRTVRIGLEIESSTRDVPATTSRRMSDAVPTSSP